MGMLLGALMAFTFQPLYERIARRAHPTVAALATVLGSTVGIALTLGGLVWLLVSDGMILGRQFVESLGHGGGARQVVVALGRVDEPRGDLVRRARGSREGAHGGRGDAGS